MRLFLLAVSLAALGALWWFLDDLLAMRAWVVMHRGADPEITRGWPAVIAAWPVALAGVLLGGATHRLASRSRSSAAATGASP